MRYARVIAAAAFAASVATGTLIETPGRPKPTAPTVLVGDFHVHAFPADGMLPVWAIQREAERRGLDVVAITNHNRNFAVPLARATGLLNDYPIVIPSQELTTPRYHMVAVGVSEMIDWRLSAREAIEAIHAQGGVALAAHPVPESWADRDPLVLGMLDGAEVVHPTMLSAANRVREFRVFYDTARGMNPDLAPIGSSDYHGGAPLGLCRTYLVVNEVSREGVLEAIRNGRTVASGPGGQLVGDQPLLGRVKDHLARPVSTGFGHGASTWVALAAIVALAALVVLESEVRVA
ncbi:MAG: CehA/McbA family metallohydrolase [Vicinamibacterales bacterium]